jgi:hypothetical protein
MARSGDETDVAVDAVAADGFVELLVPIFVDGEDSDVSTVTVDADDGATGAVEAIMCGFLWRGLLGRQRGFDTR